MKTKIFLTLSILLATTAQAHFTDASPGGQSGATSWSAMAGSWGASLTSMKVKVVAKVSSFFNYQSASPQREIASTDNNGANTSGSNNGLSSGTGASSNGNGSSAQKVVPYVFSNSAAVPKEVKIQNTAPQLNALKVSRTAQKAVPFKDKLLIMGHNNVPVFEFKKMKARTTAAHIKRIPLLNVGTEEILDSKAFDIIPILPYPIVSSHEIKELSTPNVISNSEFKSMLGELVVVAKPAEPVAIPVLEAEKKVTADKIAKLVYSLNSDFPYTPLVVTKISDDDLKLLRGLILFEKKDQCHIASGIFSDLLNSTQPQVVESGRYHLGICLHEMNLPTEAFYHLSKVIRSKDKTFTPGAIKAAVEDIQLQHENEVVEAILSSDSTLIPKEDLALVNYLEAKFYIKKNEPQKALEHALYVPQSAAQYYKAQYIASVAEYELGKLDASLARQKTAATELEKKGSDKETLALFQVNLGRSAFQKARYKDSLDAFQKVPKESTLWMQALMEEGWVQLQSKDLAGAIGNMHSIQSPYFNGVFKPGSYVVRAIGYLNICQYADAYKSLAYLEHTYAPWLEKVEAYNKNHSSTQSYETVLKGLSGKPAAEIDGIPLQSIREAARQRDFLNAQEGINQLIDEQSGYNFVKSLIEKDRKSLVARRNATITKVAQLNDKIKKARSTPDAMKNFNAWRFELANLEDFLSVYDFKVNTLKEGLEGLTRLQPKALDRIATNKTTLKDNAGKILKKHFTRIAKDLRQAIENNELIKYEIFAGSGENLRYKMAGGKTGGSANMSDRKPTGMKWDFDGEYWEDEIGNYRSSLKNNCQNVAKGPKRGE